MNGLLKRVSDQEHQGQTKRARELKRKGLGVDEIATVLGVSKRKVTRYLGI